MAVTCDSATLVAASKCFDCIPVKMRKPVQLYLLASMSNQLSGTSMDPATLVQLAKCFQCIPRSFQDVLVNYLECQIASASGA
jgi:hypothetical protein